MNIFVKKLVEADYSVLQVLAFRGWFITIGFVTWLALRGKLGLLKTTRPLHIAIRGLIGFASPFFFFTALGEMPLADAMVISFVTPFMMTVLSIPLLKEVVGPYRWASIAVGFIGVVIVLQPGEGMFQSASIYVLLSCLFYSLSQVMVRWMSKTEPPLRLVFYFNFTTAIIGTCALPFVWKPMPFDHVLIILGAAAFTMAGHMMITSSFSKAPINVISPFEYSSLVWSTLFGFLIWGDFPSQQIWIGAGIIMAGGIYMLHREKVRETKPAHKVQR